MNHRRVYSRYLAKHGVDTRHDLEWVSPPFILPLPRSELTKNHVSRRSPPNPERADKTTRMSRAQISSSPLTPSSQASPKRRRKTSSANTRTPPSLVPLSMPRRLPVSPSLTPSASSTSPKNTRFHSKPLVLPLPLRATLAPTTVQSKSVSNPSTRSLGGGGCKTRTNSFHRR
jgi:hypothetical protein